MHATVRLNPKSHHDKWIQGAQRKIRILTVILNNNFYKIFTKCYFYCKQHSPNFF